MTHNKHHQYLPISIHRWAFDMNNKIPKLLALMKPAENAESVELVATTLIDIVESPQSNPSPFPASAALRTAVRATLHFFWRAIPVHHYCYIQYQIIHMKGLIMTCDRCKRSYLALSHPTVSQAYSVTIILIITQTSIVRHHRCAMPFLHGKKGLHPSKLKTFFGLN